MERIIMHCDMNNFFASVEILLNPALRGLPVAVCGSVEERRGIVLAKSEEAKKCGVKTGDAIWQAKQKCPDMMVVPPHYDRYLMFSKLAHKIYYRFTNKIEPFGIDECWLDLTGYKGNSTDLAYKIKDEIKKELNLTISVGVSFNKIFAKLGSDLKKPDAVTSIPESEFKRMIWGLPVSDLLGVGSSTNNKLKRIGIMTIGDLANLDLNFVKKMLGKNGVALVESANGRDASPVRLYDEKVPIKSIGRGITCVEDLMNTDEVNKVLIMLAQIVAAKLFENNLKAGGVQLVVKANDLTCRLFQGKLLLSSFSYYEVANKVKEIFATEYDWFKPVRALTVRAINLTPADLPYQPDLFQDLSKHEKYLTLEKTMNLIRGKFGNTAIAPATTYGKMKTPENRNKMWL
ncbi:MAG: DNA polymerase Y family protein [Candidatus Ozemobacteraceae bacterium]|jgi:DNA polymerase-4